MGARMLSASRVVVVRPGALGDALLALPALAALRRAWPGAHVTLVARDDVLPLARAAGLADAVSAYDLPVWSHLWSDNPDGDRNLRAALGGADTVIAWVADPNGTVARQLAALGIAHTVVAPGRPRAAPDADPRQHAAAYLLGTLAPLGIPTHALAALNDVPLEQSARAGGAMASHAANAALHARPLLAPARLAPALRERVGAVWSAQGLDVPSRGVVALHPGSGGAAKCWPAERFAAVARQLAADGWRPMLAAGPADAPAVARVLADLALPATPGRIEAPQSAAEGEHPEAGDRPRPTAGFPPPVIRDLSVEMLAALLGRCAAYLGNDSGVTHLAALTGCPTLALFGPTDPAVWAPLGPRVRILCACETGRDVPAHADASSSDGEHAMDRLPLERVLATLDSILASG